MLSFHKVRAVFRSCRLSWQMPSSSSSNQETNGQAGRHAGPKQFVLTHGSAKAKHERRRINLVRFFQCIVWLESIICVICIFVQAPFGQEARGFYSFDHVRCVRGNVNVFIAFHDLDRDRRSIWLQLPETETTCETKVMEIS